MWFSEVSGIHLPVIMIIMIIKTSLIDLDHFDLKRFFMGLGRRRDDESMSVS